MGEDAVEESDGDGKGADPPEHPLVHAQVVAGKVLDPEDDYAEEEGDVELDDAGKELNVDDQTADVAVVQEGEVGEEDGCGDDVGDLVGDREEDKEELAHVAALVAMLPVEEEEKGTEEVAEDKAAQDSREGQAFEDRRVLLHLTSPGQNDCWT